MTETIGGQALVEGVMMMSPKKIAMAVRRVDGTISTRVRKRSAFYEQVKKVPFVRGFFSLAEMLSAGTTGLMWSSNQQLGKDEQLSSAGMMVSILISLAVGIGLFVALPLWISTLVTDHHLLFNILDGILRIAIFLGYLRVIAQMKDVKRLFEYHGAEHMTVHCHEAKKPLDVKHVRLCSTLHPRCGTAFIFLVLLVSIFVFSFIWSTSWLVKFFLRLLLIPVVAGVSYELLKLGARYQQHWFFRLLVAPGLWFQRITTREPDKAQIEVALTALKKVL